MNYKIITIFFLIMICGCTGTPCPEKSKDGKTYGWKGRIFRAQWDDYYQCALSYTEGGFNQEALWALDKAVKRRSKTGKGLWHAHNR